MSKVKVWFDKEDVATQLLRSPEMQDIIEGLAEDVAGRAGEGYKINVEVKSRRVRANIYAATAEAKADNEKNNTLLKALGK